MPKPTKPALPRFGGLLAASEPGTPLEGARALPLAALRPNPWQPRQHTDPDRLQELADDIATRGILQPLVVRDSGDGTYQIIAGGRRYAAATIAQLPSVPVIIVEMDEDAARDAAIVENIHREDLADEDEARYYAWLVGNGMSLREIGAAIHKSHMYVKRKLDTLAAPPATAALEFADEPPVPLDTTPQTVTKRDSLPQTATPNEPPTFRRRPLDSFMTWLGRTDFTAVPEAERKAVDQQLAELQEWVERARIRLQNWQP